MPIVVTAATGNVGRPLVAELVAAGVEVRAMSRSPDTAAFPGEVKVVDTAATATRRSIATTVDRPARVTHDFQSILGRPAEAFGQWAAEHISLFTN